MSPTGEECRRIKTAYTYRPQLCDRLPSTGDDEGLSTEHPIDNLAPVVSQVKFTLLPREGDMGGSAVNETIFSSITSTVAVAVEEPLRLLAVRV